MGMAELGHIRIIGLPHRLELGCETDVRRAERLLKMFRIEMGRIPINPQIFCAEKQEQLWDPLRVME
jgi:hypothetical protein